LEKAGSVSLKIILDGLKKLNPSIPVISTGNADMPFAQRAKQAYIWLVDPIGMAADAAGENGGFSVSIALIEGGQPAWGIVYNPLEDTVYYAKGANGSYRINGDGDPIKLDPAERAGDNRHTVLISGSSNPPGEVRARIETEIGDYSLVPAGRAMGLCLLAEGRASMHVSLGPTMEWETAAAHAIARASGKRVLDYRSEEDLLYNKENLRNDSFVAE
jgi:3'(2'), 5'-bisphosphate nucleotidase